jgi:hypothetical protein
LNVSLSLPGLLRVAGSSALYYSFFGKGNSPDRMTSVGIRLGVPTGLKASGRRFQRFRPGDPFED